jgi:hypothetical protein
VVNCDNIPLDFEYTLITAYISKGIHVVGTQLGQIPWSIYLARKAHYHGSSTDPFDYKTKHVGIEPSAVLPKEDFRSLPDTAHKGGLW